VLIFTVVNAVVPAIAEGGSKYKILSNLGITAAISGVALIVLPAMATALFKSVAMM
jgi:archaellum biogenesis protein FlaJ (TadC family)